MRWAIYYEDISLKTNTRQFDFDNKQNCHCKFTLCNGTSFNAILLAAQRSQNNVPLALLHEHLHK